MTIRMLDHVNIQTNAVEAMAAWYENVLGLRSGPRPDFPFPGAWLYAGETAVVHLVGHTGEPKVGSEAQLKLEHFAFSATDRNAFDARLKEAGEAYTTSELKSVGLIQYHVRDPDGNHIHIDFATDQ